MRRVAWYSAMLTAGMLGLIAAAVDAAEDPRPPAEAAGERADEGLKRLGLEPDRVKGLTVKELREAYAQMQSAGLPGEARDGLVVAWLEDRDLGAISDVDDAAWLFARLSEIARSGRPANRFSVRWTGLVEVPADGQYTFSICPVNLNLESQELAQSVRQTMAVWIDERQVLDSTKGGWTFRGEPVPLQAGRRTPIRVEFSYSSYSSFGREVDRYWPACAVLEWEGPLVVKGVVPGQALWLAGGEANGLAAEYRLTEGGQQRTVSRTDVNIDFIWHGGLRLESPHEELRSRLGNRLWELIVGAGTSDVAEQSGAGRGTDWAEAPTWFLESLPASRRQRLMAELAARPGLLGSISQDGASRLYLVCRVGASDGALEVYGQWAGLCPDAEPEFTTNLFEVNRRCFLEVADVVQDSPAHMERLEQQFLVGADGSCRLPVAYVLSYANRRQDRIHEWIAALDARLADRELTGDRRVNWLLARAQAEELSRSRPSRYVPTYDRFLAGFGWLEDACSAARSEAVCLRTHKELAVRYAAQDQPDAARKMLDSAAARCSQASSRETLAAWQTEVGEVAEAFEQARRQDEATAQRAYVEELRRRHRLAVDRGDREVASYYENLLATAGAEVEEPAAGEETQE